MELLDVQTAIYGIVATLGGLSIAASALFMPPITPRTRRAIRFAKGCGMLYIGAMWILLGLSIPHTAEVSRIYLRPIIFLIFLLVILATHYDTAEHLWAWRVRRRK